MIDQGELRKTYSYTLDNSRVEAVEMIVLKTVFLLIVFSGFLPWLAEALAGTNYILAGLLFLAVPGIITTLFRLPFDHYQTFGIEEKYGFNTKTAGIWFADLAKMAVIAVVLGGFLLSGLFLMIEHLPNTWWLWGWAFFFTFQILMAVIYPTIIAPLFNRFTPLEDSVLASRIGTLAVRAGISVQGIYQMDATRRSRHSNAYLSGLGRSKRIVLYDSLLNSHNRDEILAVLAHEIGHLKKNHIRKQIALTGAASLVMFFAAAKLITWEAMYSGFGFNAMPAYAGLFLVAVLSEPLGFLFSPFFKALGRRFERQADAYCVNITGNRGSMSGALKRLAKDNLANLYPHPAYVWFHYSHPPLLERLNNISGFTGTTENRQPASSQPNGV